MLQPVHTLSPKATNASRSVKPRRFFHPTKQSVKANIEPGNIGVVSRRNAAVVIEVFIVRVVEAVSPDGVIVPGEKLHDAPEGKPEQLNESGEVNGIWDVTRTEAVALCPAVTARDAGLTVMLRGPLVTMEPPELMV